MTWWICGVWYGKRVYCAAFRIIVGSLETIPPLITHPLILLPTVSVFTHPDVI